MTSLDPDGTRSAFRRFRLLSNGRDLPLDALLATAENLFALPKEPERPYDARPHDYWGRLARDRWLEATAEALREEATLFTEQNVRLWRLPERICGQVVDVWPLVARQVRHSMTASTAGTNLQARIEDNRHRVFGCEQMTLAQQDEEERERILQPLTIGLVLGLEPRWYNCDVFDLVVSCGVLVGRNDFNQIWYADGLADTVATIPVHNTAPQIDDADPIIPSIGEMDAFADEA